MAASVWVYVLGVVFVIAGLIGLVVLAAQKNEANKKPGPFCYYIHDPNFNNYGCSARSTDAECKASPNTGYTPDSKKCRFPDDPNRCTGGLRPMGCDCLFDVQCGIGLKCRLGTCSF